MKLNMQKTENKDTAVLTAKETIKNIPIVLASSIPVVGEIVTLMKDTYDAVKLQEFQEEFESLKDAVATEEYSIKNIKGIEIFFADYIETNDYDFKETLENVLKEINEERKLQGEYGCIYAEYVLFEESLRILFDDLYDREYVDEYTERIKEGIDDGWHDVSPIGKVKYY